MFSWNSYFIQVLLSKSIFDFKIKVISCKDDKFLVFSENSVPLLFRYILPKRNSLSPIIVVYQMSSIDVVLPIG